MAICYSLSPLLSNNPCQVAFLHSSSNLPRKGETESDPLFTICRIGRGHSLVISMESHAGLYFISDLTQPGSSSASDYRSDLDLYTAEDTTAWFTSNCHRQNQSSRWRYALHEFCSPGSRICRRTTCRLGQILWRQKRMA